VSPLVLGVLLFALPLLSLHSAHFSFEHGPSGERLARHLAPRAEEIYADLARALEVTPAGRITVRVAATRTELAAMEPHPQPAWAQATAWPQRRLIVIRAWGDLRPEETLAHEVCHVLLEESLHGRPVPAWLAEGLAMHYSGEWDLQRWVRLSRALLTGGALPLAQLTGGFPRDPDQARLAYAESDSLIDYIRTRWGEAALAQLTRSLAAGKGSEAALEIATGLTTAELERDWLADLKRRLSWTPILAGSGLLWAAASVLAVLAWRRRRKAARRRLSEWAMEEKAAELRQESLDQEGHGQKGQGQDGPQG